jgi:CTP synthase
MEKWDAYVETQRNAARTVTIGVVGKYVDLKESYKSINEAIGHAGVAHRCKVKLHHIDAEDIEVKGAAQALSSCDGILVPGGFGSRGTAGKIQAVRYAREHKVPFFGICLGLQIAVIEYARNVAGMSKATSEEFDAKGEVLVIHMMEHQKTVTGKGASMRLGAYPCSLVPGSLARTVYGVDEVRERHRHRFEVNNRYRAELEAAGLVFSGLSPDGQLVEMIELKDHPHFLGCQFHPEFLSRPLRAHPLFASFVAASLAHNGRK